VSAEASKALSAAISTICQPGMPPGTRLAHLRGLVLAGPCRDAQSCSTQREAHGAIW
jgi:hypothetical protein